MGLALGELVPDRLVAEQLHDARAGQSLTATAQEPSRLGGLSDHFTECITLSVGLGEAPGAGFVETLAEGTHLGPCDRLVTALDAFDDNGRLPQGVPYLRYWHGTSAVFRPVVAILGLPALRLLAFGALILATVSLGVRIRRLAGPTAAAGLLAPLLLTTDYLELAGVAHHAVALAVTLAGAEFALRAATDDPQLIRSWFAAMIAGATFVYVDLLTHVPGAWLLVAATTMFAVRTAGAGARRVFTFGLTSGLGWLVGYAGMWLGKWVFAAAILGRQRVHDDVRETIEERVSGDSMWSEDRFGAAIGDNVDFWLDRPLTWLLLLVSVLVVGVALRRTFRTGGMDAVALPAIAAVPALLPFAWYEIASNHSQIHHWFTYRSLPIALGAVLLAGLTGNHSRALEPRR